ncbi:MAG: nitrate/sulfonate/bicarbonate ABC transporter ATP-binding protein [Planctomycetaceae bacterium]|nr:MAG: nitrate/sulfonate/bicarbonate ABC transporter ATP-binding protein [Planctomycetaceae bacterium]
MHTSDAPPPWIEVQHVRWRYAETSHWVLDDVTFGVRRGSFVSILGPSGCGKSTLLRLLAGLLTPTVGEVQVGGQPAVLARRGGVRMAFVFQDPTLLPWRTVAANVTLPLELQRWGLRDERRQRMQRALQQVGLSLADWAKRPRELSGGMRMRVSLARALVTQPELIFLDEPFAALDDVLRQQLQEELGTWWRDGGWTAIFVTHNIAEAVFLSEQIVIMGAQPGRVAATITLAEPAPRPAEWRGTADYARYLAEVSRQLRAAARRGEST